MKLKALTSVFCTFTAMLALGDVVKSSVASSKIFGYREEVVSYTAKDYVQDGLIILIDGIENESWGIHDPDAKVTDLISGTSGPVFIGYTPKWSDNAITNGCCQFKYPLLKNAFEQIRDADCLTAEFCTMLWSNNKALPISTPRLSAVNTQNVSAGLCGMSVNRYDAYWNVATKGVEKRDDGTYCDWNVSPCFQYMTGHTITVGYDGINLQSVLHCDGQFIRSISGGPYSLGNINLNATWTGFWYLWTGLNGDNACYCYRLYNRKLTDAEVKWNYKVDKVRFGL